MIVNKQVLSSKNTHPCIALQSDDIIIPAQLSHNICRTFLDGSTSLGSSNLLGTFWERFSQGICHLHVQHCATQNMKQPEIYKIKDGLHELKGKKMGNKRSNVLQRFLGVYEEMINTHVQRTLTKLSIKTFKERFHRRFSERFVLAGCLALVNV